MKTRHVVLVFSLTLALVACRTRPQPTPQPTLESPSELHTSTPARPTSTESPLPQPAVSPLSPLSTPPANPAAAAAVTYLATELDLSPEEVTVLSSEPVQWSDTSLGCPQPGMLYAQVITPGYRFRLEAEGDQYDVHTDQTGGMVVVCTLATEKGDSP